MFQYNQLFFLEGGEWIYMDLLHYYMGRGVVNHSWLMGFQECIRTQNTGSKSKTQLPQKKENYRLACFFKRNGLVLQGKLTGHTIYTTTTTHYRLKLHNRLLHISIIIIIIYFSRTWKTWSHDLGCHRRVDPLKDVDLFLCHPSTPTTSSMFADVTTFSRETLYSFITRMATWRLYANFFFSKNFLFFFKMLTIFIARWRTWKVVDFIPRCHYMFT